MVEELRTRSSMEAPSFGRSFRAMTELSMVTAAIASEKDFLLDDFEFAFTSIESDPDAQMEANTEKYPVFNGDFIHGGLKIPKEEKLEGRIRRVAMEFEKQGQLSGLKLSSSLISSESEELDMLSGATEKYCVLKSNSTGSVALESKRLRLRDIGFGRTRSEGDKLLPVPASREKKMEKSCFFLFSSSNKSTEREAEKKGKRGKENRRLVKKSDIFTPHGIHYGKDIAGGGQMAMAGSRRTSLPYRQQLLAGFFYCQSRRNHLQF